MAKTIAEANRLGYNTAMDIGKSPLRQAPETA